MDTRMTTSTSSDLDKTTSSSIANFVPVLSYEQYKAIMAGETVNYKLSYLYDTSGERAGRHLKAQVIGQSLYHVGAVITNSSPLLLERYNSIENKLIDIRGIKFDLRSLFLMSVALGSFDPEQVQKVHERVESVGGGMMTLGGSYQMPSGYLMDEHIPLVLVSFYAKKQMLPIYDFVFKSPDVQSIIINESIRPAITTAVEKSKTLSASALTAYDSMVDKLLKIINDYEATLKNTFFLFRKDLPVALQDLKITLQTKKSDFTAANANFDVIMKEVSLLQSKLDNLKTDKSVKPVVDKMQAEISNSSKDFAANYIATISEEQNKQITYK